MKNYKWWTEEEVKFLLSNYEELTYEELSEKLQKTAQAVRAKLKRLGILKYTKNWTTEEEAYLQDNWGTISISGLAKKLNRSVYGIKGKARHLGLGPFIESGDYISFNLLLAVLFPNSSMSYAKKRYIEKGLPIHYKRVLDGRVKVVYLDEFWDWAFDNIGMMDFADFEYLSLGKEPKWVDEKRKADIEKRNMFKNKRPWTTSDDDFLIRMLKQGKTYAEMTKSLNRTEGAIRRRKYDLDLNIKVRPITKTFWTTDEKEELKALYYKGYDYNIIAKKMENRGPSAVRGVIERMIESGELTKRSEHAKTC